MHVKLIGVLATLAAIGAAAPYGGRQEALFSHTTSLSQCAGQCYPIAELLQCEPGKVSYYYPDDGGPRTPLIGLKEPSALGPLCWKCCDENMVQQKDVSSLATTDSNFCLSLCFPAEPRCPENFEAKQFGDCWTCCVKDGVDGLVKPVVPSKKSSKVATTSNSVDCYQPAYPETCKDAELTVGAPGSPFSLICCPQPTVTTIDQGICWLVCFQEEPKCPEQWEPKKMGGGECWTCCRKEPQEATKASKGLSSGPPCIPMCFDAPPKQCLFDSHPQQLGANCWSCCGGQIGSMSRTAIVLDDIKTKAISKTFSLMEPACVPACYLAGPPLRCLYGYEPRFIDGCWTCCNPDQRAASGPGDLNVPVKSVAISKSLVVQEPPCVPVCHVAPTRCAFGYHSAMIEPGCWSCCMNLDQENAASASFDLVISNPGICWAACFPEQIQCPPSGHAQNIGGECWTCCFGGDESIQKNTQSLVAQLDTSNSRQSLSDDPCLLICLPEKPAQCGTNGYAKQFGTCWTCCLKADAENHQTISPGSFKTYSLISHNPSKQMTSHEDICLKMCMFEEPNCGPYMDSKKFGDCWTCCRKPQGGEIEQSKHITDITTYPSICLRACFPSADLCPPDFFADPKSGNGCTICCTKGTEDSSQTVVSTKQSKHDQSLANVGQICLKACFPSKDSCPENFFPDPGNDSGLCTICCTKYGEDGRLAVAEL